ncbi:prepilin-type N-terminal cleavage/methylation domain-containing protein [Oceaniglobus trochenteri]|uniref:prepilin-type N-terminal cleavage/methylation domain-containing protein n=1 Tax=Oceaniglobus trochenteri TaxID=2763260 RepID=UPI001CFF8298
MNPRPHPAPRAGEAGFTLIEALVAMAILAASAVALLGAVETHVGRIGDLERRTAARWAGEWYMAALRAGLPTPETRIDMLGQAWTIDAIRRPTNDPDLTEIALAIAPAETPTAPLVRMGGFLDTGARQ